MGTPGDTNICPPRLLPSIANAAAGPGCSGSRPTTRSLQTVRRPALRRRSVPSTRAVRSRHAQPRRTVRPLRRLAGAHHHSPPRPASPSRSPPARPCPGRAAGRSPPSPSTTTSSGSPTSPRSPLGAPRAPSPAALVHLCVQLAQDLAARRRPGARDRLRRGRAGRRRRPGGRRLPRRPAGPPLRRRAVRRRGGHRLTRRRPRRHPAARAYRSRGRPTSLPRLTSCSRKRGARPTP